MEEKPNQGFQRWCSVLDPIVSGEQEDVQLHDENLHERVQLVWRQGEHRAYTGPVHNYMQC